MLLVTFLDNIFAHPTFPLQICNLKWIPLLKYRYEDPDNIILKKTIPPVPAYENWIESQTKQDLQAIQFNHNSIHMESLTIRERILSTKCPDVAHPIVFRGAVCADNDRFDRCESLWLHALELRQNINVSSFPCNGIFFFSSSLFGKNVPCKGNAVDFAIWPFIVDVINFNKNVQTHWQRYSTKWKRIIITFARLNFGSRIPKIVELKTICGTIFQIITLRDTFSFSSYRFNEIYCVSLKYFRKWFMCPSRYAYKM